MAVKNLWFQVFSENSLVRDLEKLLWFVVLSMWKYLTTVCPDRWPFEIAQFLVIELSRKPWQISTDLSESSTGDIAWLTQKNLSRFPPLQVADRGNFIKFFQPCSVKFFQSWTREFSEKTWIRRFLTALLSYLEFIVLWASYYAMLCYCYGLSGCVKNNILKLAKISEIGGSFVANVQWFWHCLGPREPQPDNPCPFKTESMKDSRL